MLLNLSQHLEAIQGLFEQQGKLRQENLIPGPYPGTTGRGCQTPQGVSEGHANAERDK